jgi:hypothetical protein
MTIIKLDLLIMDRIPVELFVIVQHLAQWRQRKPVKKFPSRHGKNGMKGLKMSLIRHRKCPKCGADVQIIVFMMYNIMGKPSGYRAYPICKKNHRFDFEYSPDYDEALKNASDNWNKESEKK